MDFAGARDEEAVAGWHDGSGTSGVATKKVGLASPRQIDVVGGGRIQAVGAAGHELGTGSLVVVEVEA